jgi:hypothetical protein
MARTWARGREAVDDPDAVPARPSVGLAVQVLLDELLISTMKNPRLLPRRADYERAGVEVAEAFELYRDRGWLDNPETYHRAPAPPEVSTRRERVLGQPYEHLSFQSEYEPHEGEPGRARWLEKDANRTDHAWVLRQPHAGRPWVVCVHGFGTGAPFVDLRAFRARRLHGELGLNEDLPSIAATARSHGIQLVTVWQDLAQVEERYRSSSRTLFNNHLAKLVLSGCSDLTTLQYLTQLLGESVFQERSTHRDSLGNTSSTEAPRHRALAPVDSLRQMRRGEGLLVYGHLRPARLRLRLSWRDRGLRRLTRLHRSPGPREEASDTPTLVNPADVGPNRSGLGRHQRRRSEVARDADGRDIAERRQGAGSPSAYDRSARHERRTAR